MKPLPDPSRQLTTSGFTLTELIIATAMLLIVIGSLVSIFMGTNRRIAATDERYRQEARIDEDLALISKLNEHYTCASGTCTSNLDTHPKDHGFFPDPANQARVEAFESLCNGANSGKLVGNLLAIINTKAPASQLEEPLRISRTVTPDGIAHRYTVSYRTTTGASQELLRESSFVPTTANWCPGVS